MFTFLLIIQALVALVMISVILMQRSEGGGFTGGSPSGLMTARGASDFLTRTTSISASIFVALSILLAALAAHQGGPRVIDPNLARQAPAGAPADRATSPFTPAGPAAPAAQPKAEPQPAAQPPANSN
jgi:preprotein translocase subunit SecG